MDGGALPGGPPERDGPPGRSQPLLMQGGSRGPEEPRAPPPPAIPNPFPELCSPAGPPALSSPGAGQGPPPRDGATRVVQVSVEGGACRALAAAAGTTARQLCETLLQPAPHEPSWALAELHPQLGLERCLEDHEAVLEVQDAWAPGGDSRFVLRKNFAKYELFRSTGSLFPEVTVSGCLEANGSAAHAELVQSFLSSGSCPEVQGFLQLREPGRKLWKRFHFSLRRSGLYYSTKGTSKDPRHLRYFADLTESNIYYVTQGKRRYGAPTEFAFCIKPSKARGGPAALRLLCGEDERSRSGWVAAFRLFKYGTQLYRNYEQAQPRCAPPACPGPAPPRRGADAALVPMDFSGCTGRVLESPGEALAAALEEAQAWRRKTTQRLGPPAGGHGAPLSAAVHRSQPWFHGRLSREDTQRLIGRQGLVDGVFLVRESQRNPKGFVLSLCHVQKVKHYLILPSEAEGRRYLTMDEGQTRFADLLQLVEFHQINRGILPCTLRHCCSCAAL